jgi:cytochrome P450
MAKQDGTSEVAAPYYDTYDFDIDRDPYPVWKRLRDEMPVYYNEKYNFYALSRYGDVRAGLLDWRTYSSTEGTVLEMLDADPDIVLEFGLGMLFEQPPLHTQHRSILARAFTPRRFAALDDDIRQLSRHYLDEAMSGGGEFDLVRDYANKIPPAVIDKLLGVPESDRDYIQAIADDYSKYEEGAEVVYDPSAPARMAAYFADLINGVRPGRSEEGLISDLMRAEIEDQGYTRPLTTKELLEYISLVAAAGNETTANLIGWAGILLSRNPDQRQRLVDDPALVQSGVEEVLRYEAPSPIQARRVTADVELHGVKIPKGSKMGLLVGAANRDERRFPDPDTLDVGRPNNDHLTFGHGIHFCLGAALARSEARIALEELLLRVPSWELDQDRSQMIQNSSRRGWAKLPITPN